jgi:hypothetical protein
MCASTIFLFARTMRCATAASASKKALAISVVVNPTTAQSQRHLRLLRQRGMAAREDQPEAIVGLARIRPHV